MANLISVLDRAAAERPGHPAVRMDDLVLSYSDLREAAGRVTSLLSSLGVAPGDRVGVMLPNVPAFPMAFYGTLAAGAVVVPMNPLLKSREVAYYLGNSGAKVLFAWYAAAGEAAKGAAAVGAKLVTVDEPDMNSLLASLFALHTWADRDDGDDAVILYTSGTTGQPKGAQLTHANLTRNAELTAETLLHAGPGDVVMGCLPLFHVFGLTCGLNATVIGGATLTLLPRFDAGQALKIIARDQVTIFEGVPTMYAAMLHHPAAADADTSSLRCASPAARRCRWRSCASSRRRSAASSWRATGCRRPRRSPRSTTRTPSASPARSARRSRASRCAWSTPTAPTCRPARSARSPSAATTS